MLIVTRMLFSDIYRCLVLFRDQVLYQVRQLSFVVQFRARENPMQGGLPTVYMLSYQADLGVSRNGSGGFTSTRGCYTTKTRERKIGKRVYIPLKLMCRRWCCHLSVSAIILDVKPEIIISVILMVISYDSYYSHLLKWLFIFATVFLYPRLFFSFLILHLNCENNANAQSTY